MTTLGIIREDGGTVAGKFEQRAIYLNAIYLSGWQPENVVLHRTDMGYSLVNSTPDFPAFLRNSFGCGWGGLREGRASFFCCFFGFYF